MGRLNSNAPTGGLLESPGQCGCQVSAELVEGGRTTPAEFQVHRGCHGRLVDRFAVARGPRTPEALLDPLLARALW